LGALGVVFGDIGTSPLYAFREAFESTDRLIVETSTVLGVASLILWSLIIVISIKYLIFVMRADHDGEGGILALASLATQSDRRSRRTKAGLTLLGLFGTALLYGDGMITPAISVLAAVEGTQVSISGIDPWIKPIAIIILIGLFSIQRKGTASIGKLFGPVMIAWFSVLAVLGLRQIMQTPSVLKAVSPTYAIQFFIDHSLGGFIALGSVFLVVTGGEALYADMGHFGRKPITLGWYTIVLPGLVINYFGQAALLIREPEAIDNPFFRMAPGWGALPLVALATFATVIASQALISGAFSLTMQATQLGFSPRMKIVHTSESEFGQVYVPAVNWGLLVACISLVIGFGSSSRLAAAYGVAVTTTMVITTVLLWFVLQDRFHWSFAKASALCAVFMVVDLGFFGANILKVPAGGWFPLIVGAAIFCVMTTWRTGRRLVGEHIRARQIPLKQFLESLETNGHPVERVNGTAIFLFSNPTMAPPALIANLRHNQVLHKQLIVVSIVTANTPRVLPARRTEVTELPYGVRHVTVRYGFVEDPNLPEALGQGAAKKLHINTKMATYFLGAETIVVTEGSGMMMWRERLFRLLSRNSVPAASYFGLPGDRTVTLGIEVDI
jgi:KUP system potassium uptake protein